MKLKRLFEDNTLSTGASYKQTPEQLPTDDELALEYPKISNYLDRRNQWRIDKHREEKEKERSHYADKEASDKKLDVDIEADRAAKLKERGKGEIDVDAEDTAARMLSRKKEGERSDIINKISDMMSDNIIRNKTPEEKKKIEDSRIEFAQELDTLINKYYSILKKDEPTPGMRVIDADSPFKKPGTETFIEKFSNYKK